MVGLVEISVLEGRPCFFVSPAAAPVRSSVPPTRLHRLTQYCEQRTRFRRLVKVFRPLVGGDGISCLALLLHTFRVAPTLLHRFLMQWVPLRRMQSSEGGGVSDRWSEKRGARGEFCTLYM